MNKLLNLLALFTFFVTFFGIQSFGESPLRERKVTKKTICKTWFVGQAWETRQNGDKKDRSHKARGSQFIFNENNTFQLIDKSNYREDIDKGTFYISNNDSISITFERQNMVFHAVFISKDSLTLQTKTYGRTLFIGLSLDSIFPNKKKEFLEERVYENEPVVVEESYEIPEPVPMVVDDEIGEAIEEVVEETYEIPRKEPEYITRERAKIKAEMEVIGQWRTEDTKKPFFTLSYNNYSITNKENMELYGSWTLSNELIRITNKKGTFSYKILNKNRTRIELSDLQTNKVIVLVK